MFSSFSQVALRSDGSISVCLTNADAPGADGPNAAADEDAAAAHIVVRSGAPVCNEPLCQTRCKRCPVGGLCVHAFQCTCPG